MKKGCNHSIIFQSLINDTENSNVDGFQESDEEVHNNYSFIILKDNKKTWSANFLLDIGNFSELKVKKDSFILED